MYCRVVGLSSWVILHFSGDLGVRQVSYVAAAGVKHLHGTMCDCYKDRGELPPCRFRHTPPFRWGPPPCAVLMLLTGLAVDTLPQCCQQTVISVKSTGFDDLVPSAAAGCYIMITVTPTCVGDGVQMTVIVASCCNNCHNRIVKSTMQSKCNTTPSLTQLWYGQRSTYMYACAGQQQHCLCSTGSLYQMIRQSCRASRLLI